MSDAESERCRCSSPAAATSRTCPLFGIVYGWLPQAGGATIGFNAADRP